jgi:hypothetical protein
MMTSDSLYDFSQYLTKNQLRGNFRVGGVLTTILPEPSWNILENKEYRG